MAITPGTHFDRYEILSVLGAGGMGEVYLAHDQRLGRKVAFKTLPAQFTNEPERLMRFEREARAASALNHPNIVTILDIGEVSGVHYMAHEYVEGESLRDRLVKGILSPTEGLEIAIQIASALGAAHEAGILHRDIKPENIIRRRDGFVKVLDFGLAKLTEGQRAGVDKAVDREATTLAKVTTAEGRVMGTPQYMSPEQAHGDRVDARSDIFSLGVVLYEMVAGQPPFDGNKPMDVIVSILKDEPVPLGKIQPGTPHELETIVGKALRKNREERYQTVKDLLIDLKDLKRRLEFQAELEKSVQPGARRDQRASQETEMNSAAPIVERDFKTALPKVTQSGQAPAKTSFQFQIPRRAMSIGVAVAVLALVAAALFYFLRTKPVLTDKDTILLTEFDNKTGDVVFDGTLRQGLAVQLRQSPFLDIFPDARVLAALRLMSRSPDERVTREVGREICQRQGLKALIAGSIAKFDRNYSITLEALNGQTGDSLAIVQSEAEGKDQVLKALSHAAAELREKLGESLSSIQKFDAPLEVTTSSLDALKEFAQAAYEAQKGQFLKSIEFYRRATEKDPNFASAWMSLAVAYFNTNQPGQAAECAAKGFVSRGRVSEYEKSRITVFYYSIVTGELDKAIEAQESFKRNYTRDHTGPGNLSDLYGRTGQLEKAVAAAREAILLNPSWSVWHGNLAENLLRLGRFVESGEVCRPAIEKKLDDSGIRGFLYSIAFVGGDAQTMREQIAWASGQPDEYVAVDWQAQTAAFAGEWRKSQELSRRATELAVRNEVKEVGAQYAAEAALRAAALGQSAQVGPLAEAALKIEHNKIALARAALALALSGEVAKAQLFVQELERQYPKDLLVNQLWLPDVKAALELRNGSAQNALDLLEAAKRYEPADEFRLQTVRGLAYLKLGKGAEAAAEYRKILDHRGEAPLSLLWPLAHLGLARAAALQGDAAQSRQQYESFFALWKGADADLPILTGAKKEYEKVK